MSPTRVTGRPAVPAWAAKHRLTAALSLAWALPTSLAFAQEAAPVAPEPTAAELIAQERTRADVERVALRAEFVEQLTAERTQREAREKQLAAAYEARLEQRLAQALEAKPSVSGNKGLSLSGFIQSDLAFRQSSDDQLNSSTSAPLNEDRFLIRRARLRSGYETPYWLGALELDANTVSGGQVRVVGAEVSARWPAAAQPALVQATLGLFKIPFGFEVLESDRDRLFLERSTIIRALFPGEYDLGGRVNGAWHFLRYAVAVQNGEPIGERTFPLRDPNRAKDVVGRVGIDEALGERTRVLGGVSALYGRGFHKGTPATKSTLVWQDRNESGSFDDGELQVTPGVAATPSANFSRFALGIDGRLAWNTPGLGPTVVYGEVIWAKNLDRTLMVADPLGPLGRDLREFGFYGALIQDVGSHLQLGVRFDYYDPDRDATDLQGAQLRPSTMAYQSLALAAAVRSGPGRLVFEYDINRNHLGRDNTGLPTNLADNVFTIRSEVKF